MKATVIPAWGDPTCRTKEEILELADTRYPEADS